jgi:hypothetical protein
MKIWLNIVCTLFLLCQSGLAQSFVNLNFEQSTIVTSTPSGEGFNYGIANVSGWTEYYGYGDSNYSGGMTVAYNDPTLDLAGVSLVDTSLPWPAIQGMYSILLYGGTSIPEDGTNGAAIGQMGRIPFSTRSITYWSNGGPLQVTFNGQILPSIALSSTPNYTIFGADISAYVGKTGELLFTAPWPADGGEYDILDNIQFSSSPIPEPGTFSLYALGGLLFGLGSLRKLISN